MLEPVDKNIEGMNFQFLPMPVLRAAKMDKKVLSLLTPLMGGFDDLSLETNIDMEKVAGAVTQSLQSLSDMDLTALINDTLSHVTWIGPDGAVPLTGVNIDKAFAGNLPLLYKVMMEVWSYNKFTPFALIESFGGLDKIQASLKGSKGQVKSGLPLVKSEPSQTN